MHFAGLILDDRLQKHLEGVVQKNQNALGTPLVMWPVKQFDAQHQRVDGAFL